MCKSTRIHELRCCTRIFHIHLHGLLLMHGGVCVYCIQTVVGTTLAHPPGWLSGSGFCHFWLCPPTGSNTPNQNHHNTIQQEIIKKTRSDHKQALLVVTHTRPLLVQLTLTPCWYSSHSPLAGTAHTHPLLVQLTLTPCWYSSHSPLAGTAHTHPLLVQLTLTPAGTAHTHPLLVQLRYLLVVDYRLS